MKKLSVTAILGEFDSFPPFKKLIDIQLEMGLVSNEKRDMSLVLQMTLRLNTHEPPCVENHQLQHLSS